MDRKEPKLHSSRKSSGATFASLRSHSEVLVRPPRPRRSKKRAWTILILLLAALGVAGYYVMKSYAPTPSNVAEISGIVVVEDAAEKTVVADKKAAAKIAAPSFDIVRMEKGEALIGGRGEPGVLVHILDSGKEIGTARADKKGEWVFLPSAKLSPGEKKLSLYSVDAEGRKIEGVQPAILVVSDRPSEELAVAVGKGRKARVLKAPRGEAVGPLRIVKLDYTEAGRFSLEGYGEAGRVVKVYVDNVLLADVDVAGGGGWTIDALHKLEARPTILRADMVDAQGAVVRRMEYRFTPVFLEESNKAIVLVRGDCLWNIAVREYGKGHDYVVLFEANRNQIKDPNRVYTRQVISVPEKGGAFFERFKSKEARNAGRAGGAKARVRKVQ